MSWFDPFRRRPLQVCLGAILLAAAAVVASRPCTRGALYCGSVIGDSVEFCHWDRPLKLEQPDLSCDRCDKAEVSGFLGVTCNAVALHNWPDTDPVFVRGGMFASQRTGGLIGTARFAIRTTMFGNHELVGRIDDDEVMVIRLKRQEEHLFRALQVSNCFEANIYSVNAEGQPIHYTLSGPSKLVELKERRLWFGAGSPARLEVKPIGCRLNTDMKAAISGGKEGGEARETKRRWSSGGGLALPDLPQRVAEHPLMERVQAGGLR
ncbi:Uncharacterized protein PBTT_08146 [Plasmodiophora brassicae]